MDGEWQGPNPFFLHISSLGGRETDIDLDERGWATTHADLMRAVGVWTLRHKVSHEVALIVIANDGEQPYYTARHVGIAGSSGGAEIIAYGLGKKRLDGHVDRLWLLPNGLVCAGDDVEPLALALLRGTVID